MIRLVRLRRIYLSASLQLLHKVYFPLQQNFVYVLLLLKKNIEFFIPKTDRMDLSMMFASRLSIVSFLFIQLQFLKKFCFYRNKKQPPQKWPLFIILVL